MVKTAKCIHCGNEFQTVHMFKVLSPSKNFMYVCNDCNVPDLILSNRTYYNENSIDSHKQALHGLSWSIELETSECNHDSNWHYQYNFLATHDGSINGIEWKSPIWHNLSGLNQLFRTIEKKCVIGSECGTHLNIGTYNSDKIDMLKRFYHSLFIPLCKRMQSYTNDTIKLFGRDFTYYANTINENSDPDAHTNFINLQHSTHIEFRLCKFKTADQYMNCIKMCTEFVKAINNNFIEHFNDNTIDSSITDIKAYRIHKAKITANKLVKIFDKYTMNV
jgi:hypothetical protein